MRDLFEDSDPNKIVRSSDPQTSKDAAAIAPTGKMRNFVYDIILKAGSEGVTIKEMTRANPGIQSSSITSRPKELEADNLIFYMGDKRDGSRIIRAKEFDRGYRVCGKCLGVLSAYNDYVCESPRH